MSAASRIEDFFEIDFALEEPPHAAHNAVINLAEFLHRWRRDPEAERPEEERFDPADVQEQLAPFIGSELVTLEPANYIEILNDQIETVTGVADAKLLPVHPVMIGPLLDAVFTYWVTEVRPTLQPDLIAPGTPENSEAAPPRSEILLARIDLTLGADNTPALENIDVDNSVRPYLLHTQLIQELFDVQDITGEGGDAEPAKPVRRFATVEDRDPLGLSLWIHLNEDFELIPGNNIELFRIGANGAPNPINSLAVTEIGGSNIEGGRRFRLATRTRLNNQDHLLLVFHTDRIQLTGGTLTDFIADSPHAYLNFDPSTRRIRVHHIVERAEAIDEETIVEIVRELIPEQQPIVPFVTITPITVSDGGQDFLSNYELWFHLDGVVEQNLGAIGLTPENVFLIVEDSPGSTQTVQLDPTLIRDNVWLANPGRSTSNSGLAFARFVFPLDRELPMKAFDPILGTQDGFGTLREYMERTQQRLEGHIMRSEEFDEVLVVYVREQGSARIVRQ